MRQQTTEPREHRFDSGKYIKEYIKAMWIAYWLLVVSAIVSYGDSVSMQEVPRTLASQAASESKELKVGQPLEREMKGGETHEYRLTLTTGQYINLVVEQKGIDVMVRLVSPGGEKLSEVDVSKGTQDSESVAAIADATGTYRVEVRPSKEKAASGRYEIRLSELRESTTKDRNLIAAERLMAEAAQLRDQGTKESLRRGIEKYEQALPLWRLLEDGQKESVTLNEIGSIYFRLREYHKALEYHSKALPLVRSAGDREGEAKALHNIGVTYWQLGETQKAFEYYTQVLPIWRAIGDRGGVAGALNGIGMAYARQGKSKESIEYYDEAMRVWQSLGDRRRQARALSNMGVAYGHLGELQKALENYNQALPLLRSVGDRDGESAALGNIGEIYWRLAEPQRALELYDQALILSRATEDRWGEAVMLHNIGAVHKSLGESQKALDYYDKSLPLFRSLGDRSSEAASLYKIGEVYQSLGQQQKALDLYNQALVLERGEGNRLGEANAIARIGEIYSASGKFEEALSNLNNALTLHRAVEDRDDEAMTLRSIARAERDRGHLTEARDQIEAALNIIESTRSNLVGQQLRRSFSASRQDYYEFYINLLMQMHKEQPSSKYDVAAFEVSERARARSLLELLAEARVEVKQGIEPGLKQREKDIQGRISWIQNQLIQINSQAKPDRSKIANLDEEFKRAEGENEQIEIEIRQKHPRYAALHYPKPLGLKAIQQSLDEKTVLLEYSVGKEASFLFAVTRNDFLTARLPAADLLAKEVKILREAIAAGPNRTALSNYLQKAQLLYQYLIQPAVKLTTGKQTLIIVPDGILHYLSFEVLLQSAYGRQTQVDLHRLPYLIRDYAIGYAPSATVLDELRRDHSIQTTRRAFLAYGDPDYGKSEAEQTTAVRSAVRSAFESKPWELKPLPESRREVEQIAKLYPREAVDVFLGDQASEENVKNMDRQDKYRFVHFAVHGLLNENKPQYSGLVLSLARNARVGTASETERIAASSKTADASDTVKSSGSEDGLLQVFEIFNLKFNADLVVLSACETGLGKETRGEGLIGLTQAFFYAGTRSLAVSLWGVQDRSTGELMIRFYRHLNSPNMNKVEALRQAQLELIRKGDFSHPYHWAGFVLIGQP